MTATAEDRAVRVSAPAAGHLLEAVTILKCEGVCLRGAGALKSSGLGRLKDKNGFQGARNERAFVAMRMEATPLKRANPFFANP